MLLLLLFAFFLLLLDLLAAAVGRLRLRDLGEEGLEVGEGEEERSAVFDSASLASAAALLLSSANGISMLNCPL